MREPIVTLSDLVHLVKRNKQKIIRSSLIGAFVLCFIPLNKPVLYWAEGKFRDKGSTSAGMSESFNAALVSRMGAQSSENEATTTMKSRTLMGDVAKRLGLNGSIQEVGPHPLNLSYLNNLFSHLYTEYRLFLYRPSLFFSDKLPDVVLASVDYNGEVPYGGIDVVFSSEEQFNIKDRSSGLALEGRINTPVQTPNYAFTIVRKSGAPLQGKRFSVCLSPLEFPIASLSNALNIKADKEDKTLVHIGATYEDRHMAANIVNMLMEVYQDFKKQEIKRIADGQLEYLSKRHEQINAVVGNMMSDHAKNISKDLLKTGFPNAQTAIDFLSNNQSQQQQRLLTIDLETKRLEQALQSGYTFFDHYTTHGDPGIINNILAEIRELRKQSDNLQLALHQTETDSQTEDLTIANYVHELGKLSTTTAAANALLKDVKTGVIPEELPPLFDNSKYMIKSWWVQLRNATPLEREKMQGQFVAYLEQLIRLFDVETHTLNERLTRYQNSEVDFEGIDLTQSRELYISYSKQLNELEAETLQHQYILGEMQNPEFEITSLSSLLADPVSHEMITQTSRLTLQLKETHNRSAREQQRIREEIDVKKGFLAMHLKNASELLSLKQSLLRGKVRSLQNTTLALMQQQISLLEKHLSDYIVQRLKDFTQEREVLMNHQKALNDQMSMLPEKLSAEKIIDQSLRINTGVAEEVSRLIESKNLASNLEVSRAVPVEVAVAPIKPLSPRLIFFTLFGAFLGVFFHVTYLVTRTMMRGMPVSRDNLIASGYHVSGSLNQAFDHKSASPLLDTDLETLREVTTFLPDDSSHHSLFISENEGTNFSYTLAKLLAKRGKKVLILPLTFDTHDKEGLLSYLQGSASPAIQKGQEYDTIKAGGITRFSNELLASDRFAALFATLKKEYDWVLGVSRSYSMNAETKDVLSLFDYGVIALSDQTLQELEPDMNQVTFIL